MLDPRSKRLETASLLALVFLGLIAGLSPGCRRKPRANPLDPLGVEKGKIWPTLVSTPVVNATPTGPDSYENDDVYTSAGTLAPSAIQTRSLYPAGDTDWLVITLTQGGQVSIETFGALGGDTLLALYSAAGVPSTPLAQDDDSGTGLFSSISASLPPGTYYIKVTAKNPAATMNYQISLSFVPYTPTSTSSPTRTRTPSATPTRTVTPAPTMNPTYAVEWAGWTWDGLWHIVQDGVHTWANSNSPPLAMWYGQDATGNYSTGARTFGSLYSPSFLIPAAANLRFYSWEQTESSGTSWDTRKIYIASSPGGPWSLIWQSTDNSSAYHQVTISLSAYAGMTRYFRFEFDSIDSVGNSYRGWYVDTVTVN